MMNRFEQKAEEMRQKAMLIDVYGTIYAKLERDMNWECMRYHDADDEHDEPWFTEKEECEMTDYESAQLKAYKTILEMIEKAVK